MQMWVMLASRPRAGGGWRRVVARAGGAGWVRFCGGCAPSLHCWRRGRRCVTARTRTGIRGLGWRRSSGGPAWADGAGGRVGPQHVAAGLGDGGGDSDAGRRSAEACHQLGRGPDRGAGGAGRAGSSGGSGVVAVVCGVPAGNGGPGRRPAVRRPGRCGGLLRLDPTLAGAAAAAGAGRRPGVSGVVELLVNRPYAGRGMSGSSRRGLLQGSALSPVLANLYLDGFDRRLLAEGFQVVRYSDDVAIPVPDRPTGERVLELAADAAADLQLRLNVEDTAAVAFDEGVRFAARSSPRPPGLSRSSRRTRCRAPYSSRRRGRCCGPAGTGCGWRTATGCC
jgi:hypothetical protein